MKTFTLQKAKAFLASENPVRALMAAGWTPSDLMAAQADWDSIPKIVGIYTRLLAEIESSKRVHKQSTWGPDCDPKTNLCKTPMCTAGHLVNMAGAAGYALKSKYDWAGAARLIHLKNRPDVAPQNFGSIPQEFAMNELARRETI